MHHKVSGTRAEPHIAVDFDENVPSSCGKQPGAVGLLAFDVGEGL